MLLDECSAGAVETAFGHSATVEHRDGAFHVGFGGAAAHAPALVLATGGLSIPKLGATSFAYDVARRFGLKIVEPRPALVPLTLSGDQALFTTLSGVSAEVVARAGKGRFREAALFTHRGLSGPAILQVSSYWRHGEPVTIDFLPDLAERLAAAIEARGAPHHASAIAWPVASRTPCGDACRSIGARVRAGQHFGSAAR